MPRTPRIFQQSICYHVMNRGVNRQDIFEDDQDRGHFSQVVREYKALCAARVYHWAWMESHFHLLVEVAFDNLRPFASGIQQVYAQYHHARHRTCGVFWQSRFKSKPVESGEYLWRCGRYIERNPVRGGKVERAWDYRWSSAAFYVQGQVDGVTDLDPHLAGPGLTLTTREEYATTLQSGVDDEWIRQYSSQNVVGSPAFACRFKTVRGRQRYKRGRPTLGVRISTQHVPGKVVARDVPGELRRRHRTSPPSASSSAVAGSGMEVTP